MRAVPSLLLVICMTTLSGCADVGTPQQRAAQLHVAADPHALKGRPVNVTLENRGDAPLEGRPVLRVLTSQGEILQTRTYDTVRLDGGARENITWRPETDAGEPLPMGTYHLAVTVGNTAASADVRIAATDALRVTTERARYAPGQTVAITVHNAGDFTWDGRVTVAVSNLTHTTPLRQLSRENVALAPGESVTLTWDGRDSVGNPAGPGQYVALARITGSKHIPDQRAPSSLDLRGSATFEVTR